MVSLFLNHKKWQLRLRKEDVIAIFFVYPLRNYPPLEGLGEVFLLHHHRPRFFVA
ncbi:MAG: hypothetical protein RLZZ292_2314 [Bacteroidota bacterium]|jgi:hypothetical protein